MKIINFINKKIVLASFIFIASQSIAAMKPPAKATYENDPAVLETIKLANINIDEFEMAVNFLSKAIYQTTQEYTVFNWFSGQGRYEVWRSKLSSNSPSGWDHLVSGASRHWKTFCPSNGLSVNDNGNIYNDCEYYSDQYGSGGMAGSGLYAAIDPAYTKSYGGGEWVLMKIQLPKKFRIINSVELNSNFFYLSDEQKNILNSKLGSQLTNIYKSYDSSKAIVVRKILKDILKVDALIYNYGSSLSTTQCPIANGKTYHTNAFVFLSSDRMSANNVKVFNTHTEDSKEERVLISKLLSTLYYYGTSLWQDLAKEGSMQDLEYVKKWASENAFGCQGKVPYEDVELQSYDLGGNVNAN